MRKILSASFFLIAFFIGMQKSSAQLMSWSNNTIPKNFKNMTFNRPQSVDEFVFSSTVAMGFADPALNNSDSKNSIIAEVEAYTFIKENLCIGLSGAIAFLVSKNKNESLRAYNIIPKLRFEKSDDSNLSVYAGIGVGGYFQEGARLPIGCIDLGLKKGSFKGGVSVLHNRIFPELRVTFSALFSK